VSPAQGDPTERARRVWNKKARSFDREIAFFERTLFEGAREWACSTARGDVLEIAVGTGRNLPFYPPEARITGVDLSPEMMARARERASSLGLDVDLREGDAEALEFPNESFDAVVCTFSLCSIPRPRLAVAEAKRVLRPEGRLILVEHVRSPNVAVRLGQWIIEPIARLQGDSLVREPLDEVRAEGFELLEFQRLKWGIVERLRARKPA
jgi:ubiquinone/menaquinone biosynthesis C-methylase UbiE